MRADIVSEALQKHRGNIEDNSVQSFVQALRAAPDSCADEFMTLRAKNKWLTFLMSLFLGAFALDRFYIGERKSAIVKVILVFSSIVLCLVPFIIFWSTTIPATETTPEQPGSMGLSGVLLYIGFIDAVVAGAMYLADVFTLSKKVKDLNYRYLAGFLHDATIDAKSYATTAPAKEEEAAPAPAEEKEEDDILVEQPVEIVTPEEEVAEEAVEEAREETAEEATVTE